jgi:hypothetical protein
MTPKATGSTAATTPLQPTVDSDEETEDDEEMDDGDDRQRPLQDEPDEALAGAILELAEKPNATVAFVVANEMMTRLQELRKRANGRKRAEGDNNEIGSAVAQEMIAESVARAVKREVERALAEIREDMQKSWKEVQEQKKKETPTPAATVARSWAAVMAGEGEPPKKVIPGRLVREILVRGSTEPALARRSPQEIVQAVNKASERQGAIAARKLPSGDVIITFQDAGTKEWHATNGRWIEAAFGEKAKEAKRTFAVLVKGMLKRDLKDATEVVFGKELGLSSVDKVRFRIPTIEGVTRATALVTLTSQDEAKKVCEEGVVWRAQMLNCEPYCPALQATQCYKCWGWGHTQRFCKKSALCPRCGTAAHGEGGKAGEAQCPTQGNAVPLRCPNCTGKHPAWVRWCPDAVKARGAAREAYHFRPRTFELASQQQQQQQQREQPQPKIQNASQGVFTLDEAGDGFQEAGRRKRPRGRPPGMVAVQEEAVRDPRQGKLTFAVRDGTNLTGGQGGAANREATAGLVATATPRATGEDVGMQGA